MEHHQLDLELATLSDAQLAERVRTLNRLLEDDSNLVTELKPRVVRHLRACWIEQLIRSEDDSLLTAELRGRLSTP